MALPPSLVDVEGGDLNGVVEQRDRRGLHSRSRYNPAEDAEHDEGPDSPRDGLDPRASSGPRVETPRQWFRYKPWHRSTIWVDFALGRVPTRTCVAIDAWPYLGVGPEDGTQRRGQVGVTFGLKQPLRGLSTSHREETLRRIHREHDLAFGLVVSSELEAPGTWCRHEDNVGLRGATEDDPEWPCLDPRRAITHRHSGFVQNRHCVQGLHRVQRQFRLGQQILRCLIVAHQIRTVKGGLTS